MKIFAIDPGDVESAYAIIQIPDFKVIESKKVTNINMLEKIKSLKFDNEFCLEDDVHCAIEMVASYGMAVGKTVFDTCVWIGRFVESLSPWKAEYIYRLEERITICHSPKANDANIRRALIDRYAKHDFKNGKGTKKNQDTFYGVSKDIWSAIAVGVTYYEKQEEKK